MSENTITIKEFKMWLQGVEEMQPEDWTPDSRQWARIRQKINSIVDAPPASQQPGVGQVIGYRDPYAQPSVQPGPVQMAPGGLSRPSGIAPAPNNALFGNADSPTVPVKTPNVDSSSGSYEPAFI